MEYGARFPALCGTSSALEHLQHHTRCAPQNRCCSRHNLRPSRSHGTLRLVETLELFRDLGPAHGSRSRSGRWYGLCNFSPTTSSLFLTSNSSSRPLLLHHHDSEYSSASSGTKTQWSTAIPVPYRDRPVTVQRRECEAKRTVAGYDTVQIQGRATEA